MQRADGKSRVRVPVMRPGLLMSRMVVVDLEMNVTIALMLVFMRVDTVSGCPAQRPKANAKEDHTDNPVAPR